MNKKISFVLRSEIFDHGVYPLPPKLFSNSLIQFAEYISFQVLKEPKANFVEVKKLIEKNLPKVIDEEIEIYFRTFGLLTTGDVVISNKEVTDLEKYAMASPISLKSFVTYLFIQLFMTSIRSNQKSPQKELNQTWSSQFNESIKFVGNQTFSPMSSPRSKATKSFFNENQSVAFMKQNLRIFLKLFSHIRKDEEIIFQTDIDHLDFIFKVYNGNTEIPFSKFMEICLGSSKIPLGDLCKFIHERLTPDILYSSEVTTISRITKAVVVKYSEECFGKDLKLLECEDSMIFIDSAVEKVQIQGCVNCKIFVSAVKRICSVDKCENINLTVAGNLLKIGNTIDSTFNYYGPSRPIFFGDSKSLKFGPHNANHLNLLENLIISKIPLQKSCTTSYQMPQALRRLNSPNLKIIDKSEFLILSLPKKFGSIPLEFIKEDFASTQKLIYENKAFLKDIESPIVFPLLSPPEFFIEIKRRLQKLVEIGDSMGKFDSNTKVEVHKAIQGFFREWLQNSGNSKVIGDLVKGIDQI